VTFPLHQCAFCVACPDSAFLLKGIVALLDQRHQVNRMINVAKKVASALCAVIDAQLI
jgi:hypothetical protein